MTTNPLNNRYRLALLVLVLLFAAILSLALYASSLVTARDLDILSKETVIDLYKTELDTRQTSILNQLDQISGYSEQISQLETQIDVLEYEIESRVCQSISYEEFDRRVRLGTTYVITPEKMGWLGYWTIRENVLFERSNVLARGYEFRYDLTPENFSDAWQEIHTTIRAFEDAEAAQAFFENRGTEDNGEVFESSLNLGIPIKISGPDPTDPDVTISISVLCENFQFDIKTKIIEDRDLAIKFLEEAALMVISDLSVWVP